MNDRTVTLGLFGFLVGVCLATDARVGLFSFMVTGVAALVWFATDQQEVRSLCLGFCIGVARVLLPSGELEVQSATVAALQQFAVGRIESAIPYPASSLTAGILFGLKEDIPYELTNVMRIAGLSHMLVVSGFNVSIVALLAQKTTALLGKRASTLFVVIIVSCYVVLCGAGPPVVRAGIMGSIAALVHTTAQPARTRRILLIAAVILVLINPYVLRNDVGFQLSVAATLGLLTLGPLLQKLTNVLPNPLGMRDAATTSIAASLFTLPIVVTVFGVLPLYGIPANILVAPLIPLLMGTGALALLGGSTLLGHAAGTITAYIAQMLNIIAAQASGLPAASISLTASGAVLIGLTAAIVLVAALVITKRLRIRRRNRPLLLIRQKS